MFKNIKNSSGFSLTELLVTLGLVSVVSISFMKYQEMNFSNVKKIETKTELNSVRLEISQNLKNINACNANFKNLVFERTYYHGLKKFDNATGLLTNIKQIGQFKLKSFQLKTPTSIDTNNYGIVSVNISFNHSKDLSKILTTKIDILMQVVKNSSNQLTISECSTQQDLQSDIVNDSGKELDQLFIVKKVNNQLTTGLQFNLNGNPNSIYTLDPNGQFHSANPIFQGASEVLTEAELDKILNGALTIKEEETISNQIAHDESMINEILNMISKSNDIPSGFCVFSDKKITCPEGWNESSIYKGRTIRVTDNNSELGKTGGVESFDISVDSSRCDPQKNTYMANSFIVDGEDLVSRYSSKSKTLTKWPNYVNSTVCCRN